MKGKKRLTAIAVIVVLVGAVVAWGIWKWGSVSRDAPVIAMSVDTAWHAQLGLSTSTYETALARVNAHLLKVQPGGSSPEAILDQIDGLLLAGGGDIDPELSGADPEKSKLVDRERDDFELALIRGALERDLPLLGICRGVQILNVAHGGTLKSVKDTGHDLGKPHRVTIDDNTRLATISGAGEKKVNSWHQQAVDEVGEGIQAAAVSEHGVVEALERTDKAFVVTMQWHPEISSLNDPNELEVFKVFLKEARAYRDRVRSK